MGFAAVATVAVLVGATAVRAQDAATPHATPKLRPLCTDRPSQGTAACTVDQGHWQVESDLYNATYDRSGGQVTDTYLFTSPTLKYGLTKDTDIEAALTPYEEVRTHTPGGGPADALYGVGDLTLKLKHNFIGDDGGPVSVAALPFLKIPTARAGIGDHAYEGGVIVPVVITLSKTWSLNFSPEVDVRKDMAGSGVHPAEVEIANVSWSGPASLTFTGELYAREDQDPQGAVTQCTGDLAVAWQLPHDLQLDAGVNIGLNPQTAAVQGYTGVSHRF